MRLSIFCRFCLLVILTTPILSYAQGFQSFSQETSFATLMLECPNENISPPRKSFGSLYSCALGDAQTVKWFVSEEPTTEKVMNIGLLWYDWHTNAGYGVHADSNEAEKAMSFLIDMYVPTRKNEIEKAFRGSKNEVFNTSEFIIYYTYTKGHQKDERLIVIEEK